MKIASLIKFNGLLFLLLFSKSLFSADDFETRNTISYGFKLPYSLKLDCEQSLRLSGKEQSFKQTFTELTFSYKIIKDLSVIIPIRYAIFDDKMKAIKMCTNRFDDDTKNSFVELYTKVDSGANAESIMEDQKKASLAEQMNDNDSVNFNSKNSVVSNLIIIVYGSSVR